MRKGLRSEVSLQTFALNCCVSVALPEEVLGLVSSSVAAVTDHGDHHLLVLLVLSENPLEPVAQVVEVRLLGHLRLKNARLHLSRRL